METLDLSRFVKTKIVIRNYDEKGALLSTIIGKNSFTYAAADLLMTALLDSGPSRITYLYARYAAQTGHAIVAPSNSDLKSTSRSDFVTTIGDYSGAGGLWVPLLTAPLQDTSNANLYTANQTTFFFRIPGNPASDTTAGNSYSSSSYIGALGLAVATNPDDRTADKIFSVLNATSFSPSGAFQVPSNGQTAIDYIIQFAS